MCTYCAVCVCAALFVPGAICGFLTAAVNKKAKGAGKVGGKHDSIV